MTYQIADGYNNAAGLASFEDTANRPPRMAQIAPGRRRTDHDRITKEDGYFSCELIFDYLSPSEFDALLTQFGLDYSGNTSNAVTISLPRNSDRTFANYNAVIALPNALELERGKYLGVVFPVIGIEAI